MTTCFDILATNVKDITPEEVDDLLAELKTRQQKFVREGMPIDEANAKASKSVQDDLRRAAAIEKRQAAINLRVRNELYDYVRTTFPDDPISGLKAILEGSKYWKDGARYGVDQISASTKAGTSQTFSARDFWRCTLTVTSTLRLPKRCGRKVPKNQAYRRML
jgi:hypothetical protein